MAVTGNLPLGAIVVGLVGVLAVLPAQSRTPARGAGDDSCNVRIHELEAEVRALREQLSASLDNSPNSTTPSGSSASKGTAGGQQKNLSRARPCDPPYSYDRKGIKNFNPECLGVESRDSSCIVPYEYTATGIKLYKTGCLSGPAPQESCDVPYVYDGRGVKAYKPECVQ